MPVVPAPSRTGDTKPLRVLDEPDVDRPNRN
jgi:hypothetical protein